ncbi:hypothetical protein AHF37_12287 [Paragonimus kellicotti]|nr:hypothetical protein AHF37_12287 [Paragonimus kellicotti]
MSSCHRQLGQAAVTFTPLNPIIRNLLSQVT